MIFNHKAVFTVLVAINFSFSTAFSTIQHPHTSRTFASSASTKSATKPTFLSSTTESTPNETTESEASPTNSEQIISEVLDHEHAKSDIYDAITSNTSFASYQTKHNESIQNPISFWNEESQKRLSWYVDPDPSATLHGTLHEGNVKFFPGGKLNICYNAIDRHVYSNNGQGGNDIAMIWEGDEPTDTKSYTYNELLHKVSQIANALQSQGVQKVIK
jgi:hypothetical protein